MTMIRTHVPRFRLGLLLWAGGMPGAVAVTATLLPKILSDLPVGELPPMPMGVIALLSTAQSAVVLALAVWAGVALGPVAGFEAPLIAAAMTRRPVGPVLRRQLIPGLGFGLLGGVLLFGAWRLAPTLLLTVQDRVSLPLFARVLYGGITEELLLRWGLMTALTWLTWAIIQRRQGVPGRAQIWLAISVSAVLFSVGHLPAASFLAGPLDSFAVAWVISVNTVLGLLFGYLFWRRGLESAMIAHALTHIVHFLAESW